MVDKYDYPHNDSHNPGMGYRCKHSQEDIFCQTHGVRLKKSKFGTKFCPVGAGKQTVRSK